MTVNEYKQKFIELFNQMGEELGYPTSVTIKSGEGMRIEMGGFLANPIVCTIEF